MNNTAKSISLAILFSLLAIPASHSGLFSKDVPVKVEFREARFDKSLVAKFWNSTKDKYLVVIVTFRNETLNQTKKGSLELAPNETKEIGWAEGWKFVSGETIKIEHADYSTIKIKVP